MVNFEDFQKLDLRIAKILKAERVGGSEKLLKLEIDLGKDPSTGSGQDPSTGSGQAKRQLIAGIAKFYQPGELKGKEIVVVVNLEPRILMGLESQGMLLAADDNGRPVILIPDKEIPPGTKVR